KNAKILIHGEIAGQRSVYSREIRALKSLRAALRDVDSFDANSSEARFEDAENHVDRCGLPCAVGSKQPHDFIPRYLKRDTIHRTRLAVSFAQPFYRKYIVHLLAHHAVPPSHGIGMKTELVDGAHDDVIDDVIDALRMIVESRNGRSDDDAHARELQHVLE